jgi:hypothetical protein
MQMHNSGIDLATIRKTIEGKYRSNSGNITPTPPVPTPSQRR